MSKNRITAFVTIALQAALLWATSMYSVATPNDTSVFSSVALPHSYLSRKGVPQAARDWDSNGNQSHNPLIDEGAWHGYLLPDESALLGSFPGPMLIAQEYPLFISEGLDKLSIFDSTNGQQLFPDVAKSRVYADVAGLHQQLHYPELTVYLTLGFIDSHTAAILTRIDNHSEGSRQLTLRWEGKLIEKWSNQSDDHIPFKANFLSTDAGLEIRFEPNSDIWSAMFSTGSRLQILRSLQTEDEILKDKQGYRSEVSIHIQKSYKTASLHRYWLSDHDASDTETALSVDSITLSLEVVRHRWKERLRNIPNDRLTIKALQTLIGNWRAPRGALKTAGTVPSSTARWFNGFWAWDSWKHSVGLRHADPELALNSIRTMFDYQIKQDDPVLPYDSGMIVDAIFYNKSPYRGGIGGNWNERNSKPPLATWAVWSLYQATNDKRIVSEIFEKLLDYHRWWFRQRDANRNGIAEYGATLDAGNKSTGKQMSAKHLVQAAAWESGMDNALRFGFTDHHTYEGKVAVLPVKSPAGKVTAYTIKQESVDLNSFLALEATLLARMAQLLDKPQLAETLNKSARRISNYINTCMFDDASGFYYDLIIEPGDGHLCAGNPKTSTGMGPEGWSPLFAGIAPQNKAERVVKTMLDSKHFNLFVPMPTAAASSENFHPTGYWQGRVWLDQWQFAIHALKQYGYEKDALTIQKALLQNAEGLMSDTPIAENYHPLNGQRLGATNFSWSAAAILDLLSDK